MCCNQSVLQDSRFMVLNLVFVLLNKSKTLPLFMENLKMLEAECAFFCIYVFLS